MRRRDWGPIFAAEDPVAQSGTTAEAAHGRCPWRRAQFNSLSLTLAAITLVAKREVVECVKRAKLAHARRHQTWVSQTGAVQSRVQAGHRPGSLRLADGNPAFLPTWARRRFAPQLVGSRTQDQVPRDRGIPVIPPSRWLTAIRAMLSREARIASVSKNARQVTAFENIFNQTSDWLHRSGEKFLNATPPQRGQPASLPEQAMPQVWPAEHAPRK